MNPTAFTAPWGAPVKLTTGFSLILLFGAMASSFFPWASNKWIHLELLILPMVVLAGCIPFIVRGYVISGRTLIVQRVGWSVRVNLAHLTSATTDADAVRGSIRVFGNGGLFCFCGLFRNKQLGMYRIYATDFKRTVVLQFSDQKPVVVTPDDPAKFLEAVHLSAS